MFFKTFLVSLALTATTLSFPTFPATQGSAIIKNSCPFAVHVWSVNSKQGPMVTIPTNGTSSEAFSFDPLTGTAIKISPWDAALYSGAPLLHFSYGLNPQSNYIYYDVSTVLGFDQQFQGKKFTVKGTKENVPAIEWYGGAPSGTRAFQGDTDLVFTLCA